MDTGYWAFIRTLASYGLAVALIMGLTALTGCDERYSYDECYELLPKDPNMAAGMAIVQTAKTEAATEAKIARAAATQKSLCFWGMVLAIVALAIGISLPGLKILQIPAGAILVAFGFGWGVSLAEIHFPVILAYGGLALVGIIVIGAVLCVGQAVRRLFKRVWIKEKALKEVVESIDEAKLIDSELELALKTVKKDSDIQSPETEKIVDKIRKDSK